MNHVDRRQIVLHEIRSSQVQNVQVADRIEFLLRRMQPGDWSGAFRDMRAVAAQVHCVAQAGLLHGFRDRVALSLLVFPGDNRRQHQVCRARASEGFGERNRIAHVARERLCAFTHKALQSSCVATYDAHLLALQEQGVGDDRTGVPARPQDHIRGIRYDGPRVSKTVHIRFSFFLKLTDPLR